jgi:hypothetical protein
MTLNGVELCRVFEREAPDGSVYLVGMLGDAGIAIVKDPTRTGAWRVVLSDPTRANNRDDRSTARAITAPSDVGNLDEGDFDEGWHSTDMDDSIPNDVALPSRLERR